MPQEHQFGSWQHFVPRFLLSNFLGENCNQLWCFDKKRGKSFPSSPRNVAAGDGFYDFNAAGKTHSIDPFLTDLEAKAAPVIARIIEHELIGGLTSDERCTLSLFVAAQYLRVKSDRERLLAFTSDLRTMLADRRIDPGDVVPGVSENDVKHYTSEKLARLRKRFSKCLFERHWLLQRTAPDVPFQISDCPVTLHRVGPDDNRRLEFDNPDVEVVLPIGKTLSIHFVSPMVSQLLAQGLALADAERINMPAERSLAETIKNGRPDDLAPDNVTHQNSLQVLFSSRFLFSPVNDFEVAKKMIERNPHLKSHPKWILS